MASAIRLMHTHHIHHLPVLHEGELVGMLTDTDLLRSEVGPHLRRAELSERDRQLLQRTHIRELMGRHPHTCHLNASLEGVGMIMAKHRADAVAVMQDQQLVGVISHSDVLRALSEITHHDIPGLRLCLRLPKGRPSSYLPKLMRSIERHQLECFTLLTHHLPDEDHQLLFLRLGGRPFDAFLRSCHELDADILLQEEMW